MASYSGVKYQPISLRISENTRDKYFYLFSSRIVVSQISHKIELKETTVFGIFQRIFDFLILIKDITLFLQQLHIF